MFFQKRYDILNKKFDGKEATILRQPDVNSHYFLGIDQGTTGTTALLIDERWQVAARVNVEHTQIYPRPGWVEHDPIEIWEAVLQAVSGVLKARGVRRALLDLGGSDIVLCGRSVKLKIKG